MTEMILVASPQSGRSELRLNTWKLFNVETFFKREHPPRSKHYLIQVDTCEPPLLLTKRLLVDRFSQYSGTITYQRIMEHPWRR